MIGRRNSPDGLPFRLYIRKGKFKTSTGYKQPDGKWEFRLSAPTNNPEAVAKIRKDAIERAEVLNGKVVGPGTVAALFKKYFEWQESCPAAAKAGRQMGH
ncbi:hypothetical protein [Duganella fentianensis]|uniref:hypothetical protein n=1 Tax=Duganella fentianensis TaxID=2692177 RepID=UPI0032B2F784